MNWLPDFSLSNNITLLDDVKLNEQTLRWPGMQGRGRLETRVSFFFSVADAAPRVPHSNIYY